MGKQNCFIETESHSVDQTGRGLPSACLVIVMKTEARRCVPADFRWDTNDQGTVILRRGLPGEIPIPQCPFPLGL